LFIFYLLFVKRGCANRVTTSLGLQLVWKKLHRLLLLQ